jgi:hypothetical protein
MKTRINQVVAAAIFTLLLICGNGYAKGTELIASSLETIEEPVMVMESWMINEDYWDNTNSAYFFEEATDGALALEPWMINENLWGKESFGFAEPETETNLVLESWMTDENTWNIQ